MRGSGYCCGAWKEAFPGPAAVHAPQQYPEQRIEFSDAERLCEIVVRSPLERRDLLGFLVPSREHEDGESGVIADLPDDLDPIHVREAEVENHQIRTERQFG